MSAAGRICNGVLVCRAVVRAGSDPFSAEGEEKVIENNLSPKAKPPKTLHVERFWGLCHMRVAGKLVEKNHISSVGLWITAGLCINRFWNCGFMQRMFGVPTRDTE